MVYRNRPSGNNYADFGEQCLCQLCVGCDWCRNLPYVDVGSLQGTSVASCRQPPSINFRVGCPRIWPGVQPSKQNAVRCSREEKRLVRGTSSGRLVRACRRKAPQDLHLIFFSQKMHLCLRFFFRKHHHYAWYPQDTLSLLKKLLFKGKVNEELLEEGASP